MDARRIWLVVVLSLTAFATTAQEFTQIVKGRVIDFTTGGPIGNAAVTIVNQVNTYSVPTNDDGTFNVIVLTGRYKISFSYIGYVGVEHELLVISGRESIVNVALNPSLQELESVEIRASSIDQNVSGLQSLSIEKTLRAPANFFDPVRAITSYPGVITTNDQNNSIIVRGNSPNGLLWRLNGVDIVNPNHLANAGTLSDRPSANGGGVNILSAQMLDRTDFYTGTFPARYGNALSGIIDMSLRDGNHDKFEYTAQASLIGLDFSAEGPIANSKNTSFLANYRYSTVGLLSAMGVDFGDESISFQDLSINVTSNLKNNGKLSFFGFWGGSANEFDRKDPAEWEEDKDRYDIDYSSQSYAVGLNYLSPLLAGTFKAAIAYSDNRQDREAVIDPDFETIQRLLNTDKFSATTRLLSTNFSFDNSLTDDLGLSVGVVTNYQLNEYDLYQFFQGFPSGSGTLGIKNEGLLFQPYGNLDLKLSSTFQLQAGVRYVTYSFNNSNSFEPRFSVSYNTSESSSLNLSYGLVSQLQLPQVYAATNNSDLGFTKSHHVDAGYQAMQQNGLTWKANIFYQKLFDVPVESDPTSTFSALNLLEGYAPDNLVNEGTGKNYGVDLTVEKQFYNAQFFLLGGSYYESKYTGGDGVERDTRFNGNYTVSGVYGKEWTKMSKARTIGLSTRVLYLGGLRQSPIDVMASQNGETVYNSTNPYSEKLNDYVRLDLRLSFRKNKEKYTRTFAIDIQNLTGQENEAYQYYDYTQGKVVSKLQLGVIPVLVYRIDF